MHCATPSVKSRCGRESDQLDLGRQLQVTVPLHFFATPRSSVRVESLQNPCPGLTGQLPKSGDIGKFRCQTSENPTPIRAFFRFPAITEVGTLATRFREVRARCRPRQRRARKPRCSDYRSVNRRRRAVRQILCRLRRAARRPRCCRVQRVAGRRDNRISFSFSPHNLASLAFL